MTKSRQETVEIASETLELKSEVQSLLAENDQITSAKIEVEMELNHIKSQEK